MNDTAGLLNTAETLRQAADEARDATTLRPNVSARLDALANQAVLLAEQIEDVILGSPLAKMTAIERAASWHAGCSKSALADMEWLLSMRINSIASAEHLREKAQRAIAESFELLGSPICRRSRVLN